MRRGQDARDAGDDLRVLGGDITHLAGVLFEVEEPDLRKTLHIFSFPIFDERGEARRTVHTVRDVTEDKALRAQLLQTEKLAAIERRNEWDKLDRRRSADGGFYRDLVPNLEVTD